MIIESVSIESFGKLNNVELRFHEKMNVIEGQNESGKSTLAAFIRYMLYGFTDRNSETALTDRKRFVNWHTSCAAGSMTVRTDDGKRYKIHRKTNHSTVSGRDSYRENSSIVSEDDGSVVFARQNAGDAILRIPVEIFDNMAFVGQFSDSRTSADTSEAIGNMLFSGDENVNAEKALSKLDNARKSLLHKNGKGGEIYELTTLYGNLERRFSEAVEQNKEILEDEARLSSTEEELKSTEGEIERLCTCLDAYETIKTAEEFSRLNALSEMKRMANNSKDILLQKNTYEGFCPTSEYLTELAVAKTRCDEAKAQLKRVEEKAETYKNNTKETKEYEKTREQINSLGGVSAINEKANNGEKEYIDLKKKSKSLISIGIPLCLVIVGIFVLFAGLSAKKKADEKRRSLDALYLAFGVSDSIGIRRVIADFEKETREYELARDLYEAAKKEAQASQKTSDDAQNDFSLILMKWGQSKDADLGEITKKINEFESEKRSLNEEILRAESLYKEAKEKLADKDEDEIKSQLDKMPSELYSFVKSTDINKINETLAFYRSKQKALAVKERDLREKYASEKAVAENPSEIREKLDAIEVKLEAQKKQHAAYILASEAISGAGERLRASISPKLTASAKEAISSITDGKYSDVGVDSSLSMSCTFENELRTPEAFSAGTRMAIYLSLRLSLIELLSREKVPLCMDETLVYQDDTRAKKLLEYLLHASSDKAQCFIFTCHKREAEMLAHSDVNIIKL